MNINKIKYFQVVASEGSISKAAKKINLSQPALSLQIQSLEYDLGIKLFERHNRGLLITEEGKKLLIRANLLLDWERETKDILEGESSPKGKLTIGTYTTASSYLITPVLKKFLDSYSNITISYDYSATETIIERIKNLELDCAIISEAPTDTGITAIPFFKDELILVASSNYKISKTITPKELADHYFLSYPLRLDNCYKEVERKLGKYLNQAEIKVESISFDTLKQSILNNIGITFMPKYLIKKELKSRQLKQVEILSLKLPITFSFVYKKDRVLPARIEVFKNHIVSNFS